MVKTPDDSGGWVDHRYFVRERNVSEVAMIYMLRNREILPRMRVKIIREKDGSYEFWRAETKTPIVRMVPCNLKT